jgi:hypothetical protein
MRDPSTDGEENERRIYEPPLVEEIGTVLSLTQMPRGKGSGGPTDTNGMFSK